MRILITVNSDMEDRDVPKREQLKKAGFRRVVRQAREVELSVGGVVGGGKERHLIKGHICEEYKASCRELPQFKGELVAKPLVGFL